MGVLNIPSIPIVLWYLANGLVALSYLWIVYELHRWITGLKRGSGIVVLINMFQGFLFLSSLHHLLLLPRGLKVDLSFIALFIDFLLCLTGCIAAMAFRKKRSHIRASFSLLIDYLHSDTVDKSGG